MRDSTPSSKDRLAVFSLGNVRTPGTKKKVSMSKSSDEEDIATEPQGGSEKLG